MAAMVEILLDSDWTSASDSDSANSHSYIAGKML